MNILDKKMFKYLSAFIVIFCFTYFVFEFYAKERSIKKHGVISSGILLGRLPKNTKGSSTIRFKYKYAFMNRSYASFSQSYLFVKNFDYTPLLVNKHYPILVDSTNHNNSRTLITSEDFEEYGIPFPDSLKWTNQYFE